MRAATTALRSPVGIRYLLVSSYAGRAWSMGAIWLSTPILYTILGSDAFGIVSLYNVLYSAIAMTDMGLSGAATRELARLSAIEGSAPVMRNLVRSLEWIFAVSSLFLCTLLYVCAPWLAGHWVHQTRLPHSDVIASLRFMSLAVLLQFTGMIYNGALLGLREHVTVNILSALAVTLRLGGAVAVLTVLPPGPVLYFQWQSGVNALWLVSLGFVLWKRIPQAAEPTVFDKAALAGVWKYAVGLTGMSVSALLLTEMDSVLLIRWLPLDVFAHYSIAGTSASAPIALATPVGSSVFPKLTHLSIIGDEKALAAAYHRYCQMVAVMVLPAVSVFTLFAREACGIWLGPVEAMNVYRIAIILVVGSTLTAITLIPYSLQLANGTTRLALKANILALFTTLPSLYVAVKYFGAVGAAWALLLTGVITVLVQVHGMHKFLLKNQLGRWYIFDIGTPLAAALAIATLAKWQLAASESRFWLAGELTLVWACATLGTLFACSYLREPVLALFRTKKGCEIGIGQTSGADPKLNSGVDDLQC